MNFNEIIDPLEDGAVVLRPEGSDLVHRPMEKQPAHGDDVRLLPNGSMDRYRDTAFQLRN